MSAKTFDSFNADKRLDDWFRRDETITREKFGQKLRQKRKTIALSAAQLGSRIGVAHSQILRWEAGETMPGDYDTLMGAAGAYKLNLIERGEWLHLAHLHYDAKTEYGNFVTWVEAHVWQLQQAFQPYSEDYIGLLRCRHRYATVDKIWAELEPMLPLLEWYMEQAQSLALQFLGVQLVFCLAHYCDDRGLYPFRLRLGAKVAGIAHRLGQKTIEGWAHIDIVGWPLLYHLHDHVRAWHHLEQARPIAVKQDDSVDMFALLTAYEAKVYLLRRELQKAQDTIMLSLQMRCSKAIQARLLLIAGEIAYALGEKQQALLYFQEAAKQDELFTDDAIPDLVIEHIRVGQTCLSLGDLVNAKLAFELAQKKGKPEKLPPYESACAALGLGEIAFHEGDQTQASTYGQEAKQMLIDAQMTQIPFYHEIERFIHTLSDSAGSA